MRDNLRRMIRHALLVLTVFGLLIFTSQLDSYPLIKFGGIVVFSFLLLGLGLSYGYNLLRIVFGFVFFNYFKALHKISHMVVKDKKYQK
jgi:hypothetical protein